MKMRRWLGGAAVAATFGLLGAAAEAAPLSNTASGLTTTANQSALTQEVTWNQRGRRSIVINNGHRGWRRGYRSYYGNHYGHRGYGYRRHHGPSFGFYAGPRHCT